MRIQQAIAHMKKITAFIADCEASGTAYYDTTKRQLSELQEMCQNVAQSICDILNSETIAQVKTRADATEERFNRIEAAIISINEQLARLQGQSAALAESSPAVTTSDESSDVVDNEVAVATVVSSKSSTTDDVSTVALKRNDNITKECCRDVTQRYGSVLRNLAKTNTPSEHVNKLTKLLWDWYNARFINNRRYKCKFRYSIKRYKKLIPAIVIAYGYHLDQGDIDDFLRSFYEWINQLGRDDRITDQFATPFEVYDVEINHSSKYATDTAETLYDVLWQLGLKKLRAGAFPGIFGVTLGDDGVDLIMEDMDFDIFDTHEYYWENPTVLDDAKIPEMRDMKEIYDDKIVKVH